MSVIIILLKTHHSRFFGVATMGDDFFNMLPSFLRDYWGLLVTFLILSVGLYKAFQWFLNRRTGKSKWWFAEIVVTIGLTVLLFRGGLQYKPISVLTAARYTSNQNVAAILNTTFTILKTLGKDELKNYNFDKKIPSALTYFNPMHNYANSGVFRRMNVVLIIMESFGKEYTGYFNQGKGYTPFLDSLMQHSLTCTDAYANGKKSIEGIPGIVSGIPALMNTPYISGQYNSNNLSSLPFLLKKYGYTSSFYHGGNNGTMGFENFTKMAGYDHYVGRNEYGDKDYDGTWGVYDEPFFQFFCHELNNQKQPFVATIFRFHRIILMLYHLSTIQDLKKVNSLYIVLCVMPIMHFSNILNVLKTTVVSQHTFCNYCRPYRSFNS
ncbi:MAG: LTA synthase family protein [Bacteroidota bacterium]|nr:MAG: LTA synthase family protein [Bacteroidota bacterium]